MKSIYLFINQVLIHRLLQHIRVSDLGAESSADDPSILGNQLLLAVAGYLDANADCARYLLAERSGVLCRADETLLENFKFAAESGYAHLWEDYWTIMIQRWPELLVAYLLFGRGSLTQKKWVTSELMFSQVHVRTKVVGLVFLRPAHNFEYHELPCQNMSTHVTSTSSQGVTLASCAGHRRASLRVCSTCSTGSSCGVLECKHSRLVIMFFS